MSFFTDILYKLIYIAPAVLIALSLHEFAHGWASYSLGDPTPKAEGRLSLNPIRHLDPLGAVLLLICGFGWAKPVSVDARYYENPKADMAKVALAGPIMNFLVAFISLLLYGLMVKLEVGYNMITNYITTLLYYTAMINVGLGMFNLIPIPPLDGSKVLFAILPSRAYFGYMQYERYGMFILLILIYLGAFDGFLMVARNGMVNGMMELVSKLLHVA